ncbi:hypothetical protein P691DRAFT_577583 [Macrolepiota fuliginosa MF-IS2]|uniref:C2H2-type domain-containing protein n=1 Tax=Macrolepiota fuliginosa MF-IS2 TaxID=1400762 RepID=A0A9P5XCZ2_9AGAR|nr:hypothetical protein P691DRAFT_577583 [Macrolepiota fuliginosa MF-IS2]
MPLHTPTFTSHTLTLVQDGTKQNLESAMTLLNKKSEEISRLEAIIQNLQTPNTTLGASSLLGEAEKASFLAAVESANKRAVQAEKDVNFFRDLYGTQSAFVGELQAENKDLLSRAEIAEGQVQTGLGGIRETFELRMKQLEGEVDYHKRIATFIVEQAHRTQDDEIRRRAAEHPELEQRLKEMQAEMQARLEGAKAMIDVFEKQLTAKDRDNERLKEDKRRLEVEVEAVRKELEELRAEVERLGGRVARGDGGGDEVVAQVKKCTDVGADEIVNDMANDVAVVTAQEHVPVLGEVQVYRCRWKKDGKEHCDAMFFTKEELQRHIELGGHLE